MVLLAAQDVRLGAGNEAVDDHTYFIENDVAIFT
jgi:hypothetical protein